MQFDKFQFDEQIKPVPVMGAGFAFSGFADLFPG